MIFTVGHTVNYKKSLAEHGTVFKQGEQVGYEGGIAFETYADAKRFLDENGKADVWSVWGLDADWITDTYPASDGWWCYLLFDKPIIDLG
jgi:type V secretory pathway adhesin AidA